MFLDGKQKRDNMEPVIVGNRIKELMNISKINKKELADNLNITLFDLEKKLNGEEEFYISQMMKIKEIFNLNLDIFDKIFFEEDFNLEDIIINSYK